jgi:excinuclease ABC subunit C
MEAAAASEQFELAAKYRDLLITVNQVQEKQRIASADSDDADVFGYHSENDMLAVNLFHMRGGKIVDRRELFWEDLSELVQTEEDHAENAVEAAQNSGAFHPPAFFSALLKQLYIDQQYVPRSILVPVDFADRDALCRLLAERTGHRVEIAAPQRGEKRSLADLVGQNAKQSYDQRFRVLQPSQKAIQQSLQDLLMLPELPRRIECFDISHIQGAETVASMVVWENGAMKKSDYRKFQVKTVAGVDDFASMREIVGRRYKRVLQETGEAEMVETSDSEARAGASEESAAAAERLSNSGAHAERRSARGKMPSLVLIDGGLGQLHAAAAALEELGLTTQPLASIAKREEVIYLYGQEDDPIVLDRRSPVLHLIQRIRDESHRFAITYHRKRREIRDRQSELLDIPGVGARTRTRLVQHFGSQRAVEQATLEALTSVVAKKLAEAIYAHFHPQAEAIPDAAGLRVLQ